jgi:hypothetical protein
VSASAVREMHSVLSGAFKQAVVWGWTAHNPAKLATPPAAGRTEVDLGRGEVLIASGVVRVTGRPLIDKDTKTHAKRRVAVGASTVAAEGAACAAGRGLAPALRHG